MPIIYRKAIEEDIKVLRELLEELDYDVDGNLCLKELMAKPENV